jgi:hypothetical protein
MSIQTAIPSRAMSRRGIRLIGLSFLMLFVELALIRWLGANVIYLGFFSNLVLLASFLGIGLGFLAKDRFPHLGKWFPRLLLGLIGFVVVFPVKINRLDTTVLFFGELEPSGLPIWFVVPVIFILVVGVMASIGNSVAHSFAEFRPLAAYRLDITGSLLGVLGFALLSLFWSGPVVWGIIAAGLSWVLIKDLSNLDRVALFGLVVVLGAQTFSPNLSWSPYYEVSSVREGDHVHIAVNGIPHQSIRPVGKTEESVYTLPYRLHGSIPENVLIVGAGSGNDVAIALAHDVGTVDAVEIDPRLQQLGALHPNKPYLDPRVNVIIDDGRAVMERSNELYDLIVFALPDSLVLVSGQSGLRLESYLFTAEAFERARQLLKPGGTFALYNFYREDWLIARLGRTLQSQFRQSPCIVSEGDEGRLAMLAVGDGPSKNCPSPSFNLSAAPDPVTDDYPYLYVEEREIPAIYSITLALIILVSFLSVKLTIRRVRSLRPYLDLLAMGMAFLLLETKSVVQYALWFGTTWFVNALVFAGVLLSVLAAIEVTKRFRLPRPRSLYAALFGALALAWVVPSHSLLTLSTPWRLVSGTLLTFSPIFLANLVFAQRFEVTASSTSAFGANLLGAMLGGVLEYSALLVGYRALIVLVALIYLGAFAVGRRHSLQYQLAPSGQ